jgi:hypothetical protein
MKLTYKKLAQKILEPKHNKQKLHKALLYVKGAQRTLMKLTPDFFQAGVGVHDGVVQSGLRRLSPDFHFGLSSKSYDQMTSNFKFSLS